MSLERKKPLKRSGFIKRKPVPRIGATKPKKAPPKKNSRPWINEALRDEYRIANPKCEVMPLVLEYGLPLCSWDLPNRVDVHHIFIGGRGQKFDLLSNLITMSGRLHHMLHNGHEIELTVLALWAKMWKGEWNVYEMNKSKGAIDGSGSSPVEAYLEERVCQHAGIEVIRKALVAELANIRKGVA